MNEKIKSYPKTEFFEVIDTMGVPHPFCINTLVLPQICKADGFAGFVLVDGTKS